MNPATIRRATTADATAIAGIYNHYVRTSTATFDTVPVTVDSRIAWLETHGDAHPVFVAERDGEVVGWASLSPYGVRPGWARTVEIGIYLAEGHTGTGLGAPLLGALVDAAREAGHHALIGQIVAENEPSLRLTERAGFKRVGHLPEVGRKFDRWVDLVMMQLLIEEA